MLVDKTWTKLNGTCILLFIFIYVPRFRETFKPSHSFEFVKCTDVTAEKRRVWLSARHLPALDRQEFLCTWNAVFLKWTCQIRSGGTVIVESFFRPDELTPTLHCSVTRLSPRTGRCLHFQSMSHEKLSASSQESTAFMTAAFGLHPFPWSRLSGWMSFI